MSEIIQLPETNVPRIKCPHCSEVIGVNLDHWKKDITQVIDSKCIQCHGPITVGLLLIAHKDRRQFAGALQAIIEVIDSPNKIIGR